MYTRYDSWSYGNVYIPVSGLMGVSFQRDGQTEEAGYKNGEVGVKYEWLWDTSRDLVKLEKRKSNI